MINNRQTRKKVKMALRRYIPADHMPTMIMIHRGIDKYKGALNYASREIRRQLVLMAMDKAINGLIIGDSSNSHLERSRFSFSEHIHRKSMQVATRDEFIPYAETNQA